ncbi:mucin-2-like [Colossoma macropomum]|uniref:mucin-2-like n=1 Tax=Colossoma macropomum TaxID=42526 RepID=UPI0018645881|nr:mucin-2-like [Colossoma macropomum]
MSLFGGLQSCVCGFHSAKPTSEPTSIATPVAVPGTSSKAGVSSTPSTPSCPAPLRQTLNIGMFTALRFGGKHAAAAKPTLNLARRPPAQHHSTITTTESPPGFTSPVTARTTSATPQPLSSPAKTYVQTTSPFSMLPSSASPVKMKSSSFLMPHPPVFLQCSN